MMDNTLYLFWKEMISDSIYIYISEILKKKICIQIKFDIDLILKNK